MNQSNEGATVTPITAARGALVEAMSGPTVSEIRNEVERVAGGFVSLAEIEADLAELWANGYVRPMPGRRWLLTDAGLDVTHTTDGERE